MGRIDPGRLRRLLNIELEEAMGPTVVPWVIKGYDYILRGSESVPNLL
jgi:hypothetical protein